MILILTKPGRIVDIRNSKDPSLASWEDHMKARLILVSLGLAVVAMLSLGIQAQEQTKNDKDDLIAREQRLANLFADFQNQLFRLQTRLAKGTPEEIAHHPTSIPPPVL